MTKKPTNGHAAGNGTRRHLRSQEWFNNPHNPGMTALYMERYLNYGLTRAELQSGKPIIGIAQTGNDLSPCNRHHIELAHRVREGIREAGGIAMEFPTHPIQETGKRPTAALDRNLAYLGLVEILYGYPLDGVVLTTGCDKTTPACMMAAATVNLPAIVLSGGPMLNGWHDGERTGSGTIVWKSRERLAAGEIDYEEFMEIVASSAPSVGHCNTMGTASTMNGLAEALGFSLPGCAAIPAPYRERGQIAYETGKRIVEMVWEDLKPSDILTRKAFENCIVINSAIGGSTNAPIHINALARHIGVELSIDDWQKVGHDVPLLVNMQPAGFYLGEEFHRAGGVPAVVRELMKHKRIHEDAVTVNGRGIGENCKDAPKPDNDVIFAYDKPLVKDAGFLVLKGNLFDSAIMKTSVISKEFRDRYLSNPKDLNAFEGRAIVFRGSGGLSRADRRSRARHRRALRAVHPRHRADRLPRRRRGREHAAAGGADQTRHPVPALHRRRPPVRHLGLAVDSQCFAGSCRQWRPCDPEDRRQGAHRPQQGQRQHPDPGRGAEAAPRRAQGQWRLQASAEPDAVAGDLPQHRRPAIDRRLHGARDALPERRRHLWCGAG
ncbi:dihydroxy-acid dehydratase [Bradyrhizobium sp. USDA 376]